VKPPKDGYGERNTIRYLVPEPRSRRPRQARRQMQPGRARAVGARPPGHRALEPQELTPSAAAG
jgi:hypothetical protein